MRDEMAGCVTVYNRYTAEDGRALWQRTVLNGVAIMNRQGEAIRHSGAASSSARRIGPVSVGDVTVIIPCGIKSGYLEPMKWRMAQNRVDQWTLQPGDMVVPSDCRIEAGDDTALLMESCERVAIISSVVCFGEDKRLAHWEVLAR